MQKNDKKITVNHIGIIMKGNREWALERNLPVNDGIKKGIELLAVVPGWFFSSGVKTLSLLVFTSSDWSRDQKEVDYLMKQVKTLLQPESEFINNSGYRLFFSGRIDELPGDLPELCQAAMNQTKENTLGNLNLCLNYDGRAEIVDAAKKMVKKNIDVDQVHEGMLKKYLYNGNLDDLDLIIGFGGEKKLDGFMLWQAANAEFLFLNKDWPDFEKGDVSSVIPDRDRESRV